MKNRKKKDLLLLATKLTEKIPDASNDTDTIFFLWNRHKKNTKITKRSHAYRGYASTYNVEYLNSFNPELHTA